MVNHNNFVVNLTNYGEPVTITKELTDLQFIQQFCSSMDQFGVWMWATPLFFLIVRFVMRFLKKDQKIITMYDDLASLFILFAVLVNVMLLVL